MIKKFRMFSTPACPNCQLIKQHLETTDLEGDITDCASPEGLGVAREHQVMSVPTVIFYDENDKEISRVTSLADVKKALENKPLTD